MLKTFVNFINQQHLFDSSQEVLLAISGGRDSVAMSELFHQAGFRFGIAHCNFHLRPGDCDRDEAFVKSLAKKYNVPFYVAHFDAKEDSKLWKCSIEDAARRERYAFFDKVNKENNYDVIATAHHRNDSIETFFINLLRGTGISGLHGILPKNGNIVRPMLCFDRQDIDEFVNNEGLCFVDDYTNNDDDYRRNLIRHKLIPILKDISPSFEKTMSANMSKLLDVESIFRDRVNTIREEILIKNDDSNSWKLKISDVEKLSPQQTLLFELLHPFGFTLDVVVNVIKSLSRSRGKRFLSKDYQLIIEREFLEISPLERHISDPVIIRLDQLVSNDGICVGDCKLSSTVVDVSLMVEKLGLKLDKNSVALDLSLLSDSLTFRHWQKGDRFVPFGMRGSRLLSDFFKDMKLTTRQKEETWILCDDSDRIIWVVGLRADDRYKVTANTEKVLLINL